MRRTGSILRQQKDTCSCWVCRDKKFRESRGKEKAEAFKLENIVYQCISVKLY